MIAARAQLPPESSCFFLRRQLLSIITRYIKSEHPRYAYISLELIPTPSFTQLTPVRDRHRSLCLVTSRADERKCPIYIHMHTPRTALDIYKKILSIFTSNKIQRYYNKTGVPNTTACSFHSNPSPDIPSDGCSETSASSEGNPETSSDSTPSDPKSALTFFGNSLSHSGDRAAPAASDIKGQVVKVIRDVKG